MFFDSHGNLWQACAATEEGAEAFGPTGTARLVAGGPRFQEARREGWVIEGEEWDTLDEVGQSVARWCEAPTCSNCKIFLQFEGEPHPCL